LRLDSHGFSPTISGKVIRAAARTGSFAAAAESLNDEAEIAVSSRQVGRIAHEVGEQLQHQRDRRMEAFREGSATPEVAVAPRLAAVFVDGGQLQTRSEEPGRGAGIRDPAWREDKVANLLTMHTRAHEQDPHPELPRCFTKKHEVVEFVPATTWRITGLLKNPAYAGAYAFGRTRRRTVLIEGRKRQVKQRQQRPDQWQVLLQDHHEGYITWMEYLTNQERLEQNRNALGEAVSGAARPGKGLLAGLVRCGHCGRKMRVRYSGRRGRDSLVVYYYCVAAECETVGKQICHIFGGVTLEQAVVEAVLDVLAPARMEAMLEAAEQLAARRTEKQRRVELELERARYEADRCARQYSQVEPENRLVARTLETRWNEAMDRVRVLEQQRAQLSDGQEHVSAEGQEPLRRLALDLPRLWHHPVAPFDLKKRILRTVIKEIVVYVEESRLRVLIHWQGGQHSELALRKRRPGQHRWTTAVETVDLIRQLARQMSDKQIAAQLNRLGIETAKGHTWTRLRVGNLRTIHEIPNYSPGEREARGELTLEQAADQLGVSYSTVQRMIQRRQVPAQQVCPGGPWTLRAEEVEAFRIQNGAKPPRTNRPSSPDRDQRTLEFPEDI
jgi:excisionase family DNA binding protein